MSPESGEKRKEISNTPIAHVTAVESSEHSPRRLQTMRWTRWMEPHPTRTSSWILGFDIVQMGKLGLKFRNKHEAAAGIEIRRTVDLCRSEKGQEKRNNAEKFKAAQTWEEDGMGKQKIRRFLRKYT
jgi:hypothetical protein